MTRRTLLESMLVSAAGVAVSCARLRPARFMAFSLREAQRRHETGKADEIVSTLGGITRLAGAVHDANGADCILAGSVQLGADPIRLEDIAAALDAVFRVGEYPLVSIDRTPATASTGRQRVRVEGVRRDSPFASQLISADVLLKKAALQLPPAETISIPSYYLMCVESARQGGREGRTASRLWFYAQSPSLLIRDTVAAIRDLRIGVRTEMVSGAGDSRPGNCCSPGPRDWKGSVSCLPASSSRASTTMSALGLFAG
jgi:hypothetical protein